MSNRSHTFSRLDLRATLRIVFLVDAGVFTIKAGRESQKGERIIPFSLPTLYKYYILNLRKIQIFKGEKLSGSLLLLCRPIGYDQI